MIVAVTNAQERSVLIVANSLSGIGRKMNRVKYLSVAFVLGSAIFCAGCGDDDYDTPSTQDSYSYDSSDPYYSSNDTDGDGKLTADEWQNAMGDAIDDYSNSNDYSDSYSDNYSQNYGDSYSYDGSEGYAYDPSDPYYSANDVNGDGKLTDEEWQNAMSDAIDDYINAYGN